MGDLDLFGFTVTWLVYPKLWPFEVGKWGWTSGFTAPYRLLTWLLTWMNSLSDARADFEHIYLIFEGTKSSFFQRVKSTCKKPWLWRYWRHISIFRVQLLRCERSLAQIHGSVVDCERASNVTWLRPRARRPDPGTNTRYNSKLIKLVKYCKIVQCHQFSSAFEVSEVSFVLLCLAETSWNQRMLLHLFSWSQRFANTQQPDSWAWLEVPSWQFRKHWQKITLWMLDSRLFFFVNLFTHKKVERTLFSNLWSAWFARNVNRLCPFIPDKLFWCGETCAENSSGAEERTGLPESQRVSLQSGAIPAEPQHFLLVVSLNHTIGTGQSW